MGHPQEENIRPWFYPWSLMSRLFPRDARMVSFQSSGPPNLRVIAGEPAGAKQLNVLLVNNADETRTVRLRVPGLGQKTARLFHYFENDRPADDEGFAIPAATLPNTDLSKGLTVVLTGRGCVFVAAE